MKTLEEHNKEMRERYRPKDVGTGIQCPHCGDEMFYTEPGVILLSYPPQKKVHCKTCKYHTTIL
jgi:DNA-directed RNA polymerase subunit RPC12/RpoP